MIVYRILMPMIAGILFAGVVGCEDSGTSSDGETLPKEQWSENLITNNSFEFNGQPTLAGWRAGNPDLATPFNEAPPTGGEWCLQLVADWAPTMGFVLTTIPEVEDGDILRLSCYVRAINSDGGGSISLVVGSYPFNSNNYTNGRYSSDTTWTYLSVQDTVELGAGDSVMVLCSSFHTEITPRIGLFDLVTLQRIEN